MSESEGGWPESASELFIDIGAAFIPSRDEQIEVMTSLIPAEKQESFVAVDLACGAGPLSAALLEGFPACRVVALDGSPTMLAEAARTLEPWRGRFTLQHFDLKDDAWLETLPAQVRSVVSSLAIHHLDAEEKQRLFRGLARRMEPGGALLIADILEPVNEWVRQAWAAAWDADVCRQSEEIPGREDAYRRFVETEWNLFRFPDPGFDKPSELFDQLQWLRDAGFSRVDCFWLRVGHAIYGGYLKAS